MDQETEDLFYNIPGDYVTAADKYRNLLYFLVPELHGESENPREVDEKNQEAFQIYVD